MYQEILIEKGELFNERYPLSQRKYTVNLTCQFVWAKYNINVEVVALLISNIRTVFALRKYDPQCSGGNGQSVIVLMCFHSRAKHVNTLQKSILNVCIVTQ